MRICIDPGHGGRDPGAVNGKRYEKDDVLRLALRVKTILEKRGVEVVLTRESDREVTIADRCALGNEKKCDYFLSLHRDAAGPLAYGVSMWVYSKAETGTLNKAQAILDAVLAVTPTYNRKVNKGTPQTYPDFGVNVQTLMDSALLELGFITNSEDNKRFDDHFEAYAHAIAEGLCKGLGLPQSPQTGIDWQKKYEQLVSELKALLQGLGE